MILFFSSTTMLTAFIDGSALLLRRFWHCDKPLPDSREDTRILKYHILAVDRSTIRSCGDDDFPERMACRSNGRAVLSYHWAFVFFRHCIHHRSNDDGCRSSIFRHDAYARWSVHWIRCRARLDIKYFTKTSCEGRQPFLNLFYTSRFLSLTFLPLYSEPQH